MINYGHHIDRYGKYFEVLWLQDKVDIMHAWFS